MKKKRTSEKRKRVLSPTVVIGLMLLAGFAALVGPVSASYYNGTPAPTTDGIAWVVNNAASITLTTNYSNDLLLLYYAEGAANFAYPATTSPSVTWHILGWENATGQSRAQGMYYATWANHGSITVTPSSNSALVEELVAVNGTDPKQPFDHSIALPVVANTGGASSITGTGATVNGNDTLLEFMRSSGTVTFTVGGGWTQVATTLATAPSAGLAKQILPTAKSVVWGFNISTTTGSQGLFGVATEPPQPSVTTIPSYQLQTKCPPYANVTVTVHNTMASTVTGTYDQKLVVNSATYASYIVANWSNVYFVYPNGTNIPTWIEANASSASSTTVLWLKLYSIAGGATQTLYMNIALSSCFVLSEQGPVGVSPTLSNTSAFGSGKGYAVWDDGWRVFDAYDNFTGPTLSSFWIPSGLSASTGRTYINDGFKGQVTNGVASHTDAGLIYNAAITRATVIESFSQMNSSDTFSNVGPGWTNGSTSTAYMTAWGQQGRVVLGSGASIQATVIETSQSPALTSIQNTFSSGVVNSVYFLLSAATFGARIVAFKNYTPANGNNQSALAATWANDHAMLTCGGGNTKFCGFTSWWRTRAYEGVVPTVAYPTLTVAAPTAPSSLDATATGISTAVLTWGSATGFIVNYTVARGTVYGTYSAYVSAGVVTTLSLSGLSHNTTYFLVVWAWTNGSAGPKSNVVPIHTASTTPPVVIPSVLTGSAGAVGGVVYLNWTAPTNVTVSNYSWDFAQVGHPLTPQGSLGNIRSLSTTQPIGHTYDYQILSWVGTSRGPVSNVVSITTPFPNVTVVLPPVLTVFANGTNQAVASWSAAVNVTVVNYTLGYGLSYVAVTTLVSEGLALTAVVNGLAPNTTYWFGVETWVSGSVVGPLSNLVGIRTLSPHVTYVNTSVYHNTTTYVNNSFYHNTTTYVNSSLYHNTTTYVNTTNNFTLYHNTTTYVNHNTTTYVNTSNYHNTTIHTNVTTYVNTTAYVNTTHNNTLYHNTTAYLNTTTYVNTTITNPTSAFPWIEVILTSIIVSFIVGGIIVLATRPKTKYDEYDRDEP